MGEALWMAAAAGNEAELRQLIGRGESVNWHAPPYGTQCSPDVPTALMIAVASDRHGCVRILLDSGATVNDATRVGSTALHIAASVGNLAIAELLLQRGADPSIRTQFGKTAFDVAGRSKWGGNRSEMVALLSEHRCA
jgi:ankyrin repeat protein